MIRGLGNSSRCALKRTMNNSYHARFCEIIRVRFNGLFSRIDSGRIPSS